MRSPPPARLALIAALFLAAGLGREWLRAVFFWLDGANLLFHEAGHPIFGLLGIEFLTAAGGTLMQLLIPLVCATQFLREGKVRSADCALFWFGQNFLGIGRYMADARAQVLPLVGGGEHDWTYLLERLGLLTHDVGLGRAAEWFGCLVMAAVLGWGLRGVFAPAPLLAEAA